MNQAQRSRLVVGVLLVLAGAWLLAVRLVPALKAWAQLDITWPLTLVLIGAGLLVLGIILGAVDMAVPACIVAGLGGIFYFQNLTGKWDTWAYAWALIPGFVGVGVMLAGLLGRRGIDPIKRGADLVLISLILFVVFAALAGGLTWMGTFWPLLLVAAGVILLLRAVLR